MLRRLHPDQPESFEFTPGNLAWAKEQIGKYPEGRQASAVIPLLWRAQEQEGWVSRPAIEYVAQMLGMAPIRVLEVATFYFMFHLAPMGSVAHIQVCGTTSCMICGSEDLMRVCQEKISPYPHELSPDGRFTWEEVECLGACANAPMAQIGKDYYEDLTAEKLASIIDAFARGEVPTPGPQNGRFASEPLGGLTSLTGVDRAVEANASVQLARDLGDTVARITGDPRKPAPAHAAQKAPEIDQRERTDKAAGRVAARRPSGLPEPRAGGPEDLSLIEGMGPRVIEELHGIGVYHFGQIAEWGPEEVAWADESFEGRCTSEGWVEQAGYLAQEGETDYSQDQIRQDQDE